MQEQTVDVRAAELAAWYGETAGPTAAQWRRVLSGPQGAPITLINFFKLRAVVRDGDGASSGMDAMMRYAAVSGPTLVKVGGRFLLTGAFEATFMGEDEDWDLVAIAAYPDRAALFALLDDDAYRAAWADRVAAVERQRVVVAAG
ncbi:MAG: DUF1330 domain-containing protein [Candidatus Binatia bacterium]